MKHYILNFIWILGLIVLFGGKSFSQETSLNNTSLYNMNKVLINPANTGIIEKNRFFLNLRNQWVDTKGSPTTATVGLTGYVSDNVSLGGMIMESKKGLLKRDAGIINYSYRLKAGEEHHLFFGFSGIFQNNSISSSDIISKNKDNILEKSNENFEGTIFGTGFGLTYVWGNLEIGVSIPEMFTEKYDIKESYFGYIGYKFKTENFTLEPSFLYREIASSPSHFDLNLAVFYKEKIWIQATYREGASIVFALGTYINKFRMGYAYEINIGDLAHFKNSSLEAFIAYDFDWYEK